MTPVSLLPPACLLGWGRICIGWHRSQEHLSRNVRIKTKTCFRASHKYRHAFDSNSLQRMLPHDIGLGNTL